MTRELHILDTGDEPQLPRADFTITDTAPGTCAMQGCTNQGPTLDIRYTGDKLPDAMKRIMVAGRVMAETEGGPMALGCFAVVAVLGLLAFVATLAFGPWETREEREDRMQDEIHALQTEVAAR